MASKKTSNPSTAGKDSQATTSPEPESTTSQEITQQGWQGPASHPRSMATDEEHPKAPERPDTSGSYEGGDENK